MTDFAFGLPFSLLSVMVLLIIIRQSRAGYSTASITRQREGVKRVAMGVSSCSVIGDFWPVVHRESRILLVVHRARYMAVIRES